MSNYYKISFILLSALCYSLFFYQFAQITRDYLRYKTITKVEYHFDDRMPLPAVTIIFFELPVPFRDLYERAFPKATQYADRFGTPYKNIDDNFYWDRNSSVAEHCGELYKQLKLDDWEKNQTDWNKNYYYSQLWACVWRYYGDRKVKDHLADMPNLFGKIDKKIFDCWTSDRTPEFKDKNLCDVKTANYSLGRNAGMAITTVHNWPPIKHWALVVFTYRYKDIMPFREWGCKVLLHAADAVPNSDRALFNYPDQNIHYHSLTMERMPPPWDTGCHDYRVSRYEGAISQSDCTARCLFTYALNETGNGTSFNGFFMRYADTYTMKSELFPENATLSEMVKDKWGRQDTTFEEFREVESRCQQRCPAACHEVRFDWSLSATSRRDKKHIRFWLRHKYENDQIFSFRSSVDWFTFLADIGGIAGMWTGLSFLTLWSGMLKGMFTARIPFKKVPCWDHVKQQLEVVSKMKKGTENGKEWAKRKPSTPGSQAEVVTISH